MDVYCVYIYKYTHTNGVYTYTLVCNVFRWDVAWGGGGVFRWDVARGGGGVFRWDVAWGGVLVSGWFGAQCSVAPVTGQQFKDRVGWVCRSSLALVFTLEGYSSGPRRTGNPLSSPDGPL